MFGAGEKILGSATDIDGNYRIDNVPVGRQTIKISYIGYEDQTQPESLSRIRKRLIAGEKKKQTLKVAV